MGGALVVLEGIDQAGKLTQARAIQEHVRGRGLACEVRHYPDYGTAIGALIRASLHGETALDARTRCMLFAANRWEKDGEIRTLRNAGTLVVADRYTWSNVVYGLSQGLEEAWLRRLEDGLQEADVTLLVDITAAESRRRKAQGRDDYERDPRLLEEARSHYVRFARQRDWVVLDGEAPAAQVSAQAILALETRLGPRIPELQRTRGGA